MRIRPLGVTAFAASVGMVIGLGKADAQLFFNYDTVYNSANSTSSSANGSTSFVPDNPLNLAHPYLVVTPQGAKGATTPSSVNLITLAPTLGTLGMTDGQAVNVNTAFSVQFNLAQSDAAGKQIGNVSSLTYNGTLVGTLTVNSDSVTLKPNPKTNPSVFSLQSGGVHYGVAVNGFTDPGKPGDSLGSLAATVEASPEAFITPEPGAVALLLGAAVPGTLFALRLRRRR